MIGGRGEDWTRFLLLFLVLEACEQVRSQTASSSSSSFAWFLFSVVCFVFVDVFVGVWRNAFLRFC